MAEEWTGLVNSQAKLVEVYSQKVKSGGYIGESGQRPRLSPSASRLGLQWPEFPWLSNVLGLLVHDSIFINGCKNNSLCFSESQRDFQLGRLGSLLDFLIGSLITRDLNMTWDPL
ncbi:hypothetical protein TNCV_4382831 [Trichonephila clavipes]|nr:hypothetical protein TNCV_4382831 [Trichonephila clavipes]